MFQKQARQKISTREKKKEPSIFFKVAYLFILMIFVAVAIYVLIFSHFMRINNLNLEGTHELEYAAVYAGAKELLSGRYWNIFPKDNFLLVSRKGIRESLLEKFKKIRLVTVEKKFPDTVNIRIEERDALIIWCAGEKCYIIDEQGFAYMEADFEAAELKENNLVKLMDGGAQAVTIGEQILEEEYVKFIFHVRETFREDLHLDIEDEYATKYRISGEVEVRTKEGWAIYLNSRLPLEKSARTVKTFLENEIDEETRRQLEYLDLRIENKVYYKVKNTEPPAGVENLPGEAEAGGAVVAGPDPELKNEEKKKQKD